MEDEKQLNGSEQVVVEASKPCFNALKHGILSVSTTAYEKVDYEAMYAEFETHFQPQNILEKILLERIVLSYIKLARINKAEAELMLSELDPSVIRNDLDLVSTYTIEKQGYKKTISTDTATKLDVYARYETSTENRMYKAINTLISLRSNPALVQ